MISFEVRHGADERGATMKRQYDGCTTQPDSRLPQFVSVSEHGYSYSMGIGDCWSVQVPTWVYSPALNGYLPDWRGGFEYNYGLGKPHYPVPATIDNARVAVAHDDDALWQWLSNDERMFVLLGE